MFSIGTTFIGKLGQNTQNTKTCRGRRKEEIGELEAPGDGKHDMNKSQSENAGRTSTDKALASTEQGTDKHWTRH